MRPHDVQNPAASAAALQIIERMKAPLAAATNRNFIH
jgi:hypothetical protein